MTFIQPQKRNSILNKILFLLTVNVIVGAFWLVMLYNNSVNFNHGLVSLRGELQQVEARNAQIKDALFRLFNDAVLHINQLGLVQEKNPQYFEINSQWSYASGY